MVTDLFSRLARLARHLTGNWCRTPAARDACGLAARRCGEGFNVISVHWPWGPGRPQGGLVSPGLERGLLDMAHMVQTQSEDKGWELQMDLVPTGTSLLKDSDGKTPLTHRRLFF